MSYLDIHIKQMEHETRRYEFFTYFGQYNQ